MAEQNLPEPAAVRRIRSYVLRAGRLTAAQRRALDELWPRYGLEDPAAELDLESIFGRRAPRLAEIGFGSGEALLAHAISHPEIDHLGIEVHPPGVGRFLIEAHEAAIANARVIRHDAVEVLSRWLAPGTIDAIHLFFPDPWPKKRHHKRRIVQPAFADLAARVLVSGGVIRLATDWTPYAQQMLEVFESSTDFDNAAGAGAWSARTAARPLTRFELRGQRLGHEVRDLAFRRR
jgi:tRNA (guanine-N7-)-methyltransferase